MGGSSKRMTEILKRIRTCVGCRAERPKNEMLRVVKVSGGVITMDTTGRQQGRGAYLCPDTECLRMAVKKKALSRALRHPVGNEIYAMMEQLCSSRGNAAGR